MCPVALEMVFRDFTKCTHCQCCPAFLSAFVIHYISSQTIACQFFNTPETDVYALCIHVNNGQVGSQVGCRKPYLGVMAVTSYVQVGPPSLDLT